jgi:hypothetical protein
VQFLGEKVRNFKTGASGWYYDPIGCIALSGVSRGFFCATSLRRQQGFFVAEMLLVDPSLEVSNEGHHAACRTVPARGASKSSAVARVIEVVSLASASGWYWEVFRLL